MGSPKAKGSRERDKKPDSITSFEVKINEERGKGRAIEEREAGKLLKRV